MIPREISTESSFPILAYVTNTHSTQLNLVPGTLDLEPSNTSNTEFVVAHWTPSFNMATSSVSSLPSDKSSTNSAKGSMNIELLVSELCTCELSTWVTPRMSSRLLLSIIAGIILIVLISILGGGKRLKVLLQWRNGLNIFPGFCRCFKPYLILLLVPWIHLWDWFSRCKMQLPHLFRDIAILIKS